MCEIFLTIGQIERQRLEILRYDSQKTQENEQEGEL
jgi:hypothetical protein